MKNKKPRSGFTLPEVLMSTVLSAMVFVALGTLLFHSFSIWYSGMAQWKLASHARVTRVRLLDGGFGRGSGILSATHHTIGTAVDYTGAASEYVEYDPVLGTNKYRAYGCISETGGDMWLQDLAATTWIYAQSVKNVGAEAPDVKVGSFNAELNAAKNELEMTYTLLFSAAGRDFEQPQTIRAVLLNVE